MTEIWIPTFYQNAHILTAADIYCLVSSNAHTAQWCGRLVVQPV